MAKYTLGAWGACAEKLEQGGGSVVEKHWSNVP